MSIMFPYGKCGVCGVTYSYAYFRIKGTESGCPSCITCSSKYHYSKTQAIDYCNKCYKGACEEHLFEFEEKNICTECITWNDYYQWVTETNPDAVHTLDWDEHPEDYDEICFCTECRSEC